MDMKASLHRLEFFGGDQRIALAAAGRHSGEWYQGLAGEWATDAALLPAAEAHGAGRGSAYEISSYAFKISSQRQRAPGSACRMVSTFSYFDRCMSFDRCSTVWKLLSS